MRDMAATSSPHFLSKLARLALTQPQYQAQLLPLLRRRAAQILPAQARLRVELRRMAALTKNSALAEQILSVLDERTARFEEGTSVDVEAWLREKGLDEAADDWASNTEKYKDKFK